MTNPDFNLFGKIGDTVFLLRPLTQPAKDWITEHIPDDAQRLGDAVAIEHRYVSDIVEGVLCDGLTIK